MFRIADLPLALKPQSNIKTNGNMHGPILNNQVLRNIYILFSRCILLCCASGGTPLLVNFFPTQSHPDLELHYKSFTIVGSKFCISSLKRRGFPSAQGQAQDHLLTCNYEWELSGC